MKNKDLTIGSIPHHVRDLALPSSIGLFFHTMYNNVDTYYAGQESTMGLAAVGLSFPVFLLVIAASSGLSRGAAGLISNAIGAGLIADQKRYVAQSLSAGLTLSVALAIIGLVVSGPIFQFLGADGEYLRLAKSYINPIFLGSLFFIVGSLSNAILSSSGDTKTYGFVLVAGFFLNLVLDPWFMKGGFGLPAMGIAGIAWATVLIQMLSSFFLLFIVFRRQLLDVGDLRAMAPDFSTWREIAVQALPATFNVMSIAIGFFAVTWFLKSFGEPAVAAYAVTTRIEQIALMPTFGLYAAIMALVGQNNGAGKVTRVRETMRFCNIVGFSVNVVMASLMFLFSRQLMGIFTDDVDVIELGVTCLNVIAPIHWSYIMTSTHMAMLQAVKRPAYGFFESIMRKIILPLPVLWLLIVVWNKDIVWIWYCNAAINILMTAVTVSYARRVLNRLAESSHAACAQSSSEAIS